MVNSTGSLSSDDDLSYQPKIQLPSIKKTRKSVRFPVAGVKPQRGPANMFILDSDEDYEEDDYNDDENGSGIDVDRSHLESGGGHRPGRLSHVVPSFGGHTAPPSSQSHGDIDSDLSTHSGNPFISTSSYPQPELEYSSESDDGGNSIKSHHLVEADITEQQLPQPPFALTEDDLSGDRSSPGGLRGILRKMSLRDKFGTNNDTSNSDTFIGHMMQSGGGLGSGGLAPGASHAGEEGPEDLDAEKVVGFEEGPDAIELKRLNPRNINEEALNLLSVHAPSIGKKYLNEDPDEDNNKPNNFEASSSYSGLTNSDQFYVDNPDLYLRNNGSSDEEDFGLDEDNDYVAPPKHVQAGVLSSLLKLYQQPQASKSTLSLGSRMSTLGDEQQSEISRPTSTTDMLKKFGFTNKMKMKKKTTTPTRSESDSEDQQNLGGSGDQETNSNLASFRNAVPKAPKKIKMETAGTTNTATKNIKKLRNIRRHHHERNAKKITVHIEKILYRQRFIVKMCKALMLYGAPTHRLEEYMTMTSRVLEIDGQFIYFPGCMMISFGDAATRTSEVHLVRCAQGLNLYKLSRTHKVYKDVIHDLIGVDDASHKLDELMKTRNLYAPWMCVILYGLGSLSVCPWAFGGGWLDLPVAFGIGLCVGYMQFFVSSISNLYSSVFEVSASIVVSFIARGLGSINNSNTFCFGALVQSCLALILPGYIILCGSLELQSRNLVAGSVRMFYAIIYSLFLGFGITLGAALYGWIDKGATNVTICPASHQLDSKWRILFVPLFTATLGLINQAEWKQLPIMIGISSTAYIATFFAGKHFQSVTEFTACIGAFIIGVLGNLYSRIGKGMAVSAMLPAIFVQVPSGIALQSSLLAGVQSANKITHSNSTTLTGTSSNSLSFGVTMVEVAIGISVGLFAAALCVYPLGKKKTGLFAL